MLKSKSKFLRRFQKRFFLRFHMSLILTATTLSGVLANALLQSSGLDRMLYRYPLAVIIAYGCFFLFIRLWLWYTTLSNTNANVVDAGDVLDLADLRFGSPSSSSPQFQGGGGEFGGGGASGSFGSDASDSFGGIDLDVDLDGKSGLALLILGVIIAAIFGAAIYLVYSAPAILSEAAFEALLAAGLIKRTKLIDDPDWMGSVLHATWIPFAVVLAVTSGCAWYLQTRYPELTRLIDLLP